MNILAWVLGMISILAILTYVKLEHFVADQSIETYYLGQREADREADRTGQTMLYQQLTAYSPASPDLDDLTQDAEGASVSRTHTPVNKGEKRSKPQTVAPLHLDLVPHNARLNLASLFKERKNSNKDVRNDQYYTIAVQLLNHLYKDCDFFQQVPHAEYALLDALLENAALSNQKECPEIQQRLSCADDLSMFQFEDPALQEIFYHILKGGEAVKEDRTVISYPSLLEFIIIEPNRRKFKINVHYAPKELLSAVLNHSQAAEELVAVREALHTQGGKIGKNGLHQTKLYLDEEKVRMVLNKFGLDLGHYLELLDLSSRKPSASELLRDRYIDGNDPSRKVVVKKKISFHHST